MLSNPGIFYNQQQYRLIYKIQLLCWEMISLAISKNLIRLLISKLSKLGYGVKRYTISFFGIIFIYCGSVTLLPKRIITSRIYLFISAIRITISNLISRKLLNKVKARYQRIKITSSTKLRLPQQYMSRSDKNMRYFYP